MYMEIAENHSMVNRKPQLSKMFRKPFPKRMVVGCLALCLKKEKKEKKRKRERETRRMEMWLFRYQRDNSVQVTVC